MKDYVQQRNERWKKIFPEINQQGFWGRINRLATFYQNECENLLTLHNIKRNEYEILCSLLYSGAPYTLTPKEITAYSFKTPGAITNGLDNLEQKGLVRRMPNAENRRSTLVALTKEGEKLIKKIFPECAEMENALLSFLSQDKLASAAESMKELLCSLEDNGKLAVPDLPSEEISE